MKTHYIIRHALPAMPPACRICAMALRGPNTHTICYVCDEHFHDSCGEIQRREVLMSFIPTPGQEETFNQKNAGVRLADIYICTFCIYQGL